MIVFTLIERVDWTRLLAILFSAGIGFSILKTIYNITFHSLARFPGPILAGATPLPFVWHLFRGDQPDWLTDYHERYGSVVRIAPGELSYSSVDAWRDIYGHDSPAAGRKWSGIYDKSNPQFQTMQGADNETHPELRRIFSPAFSEKNLREQEPLFQEVVTTMTNRIKQCVQEKPDEAIDMTQFFMYVTFDIMGNFTFAQPFGMIQQMKYLDWISGQFDHLRGIALIQASAYLRVLRPIVKSILWIFRERLNASLKFATEKVDQRIKRSAPEKGNDIWALTFRENKFGRKLSHKEMCTHALLFLLAGTETSALALTGLLWYLHINPTVSSKLTSEVRSAFKSIDEINMKTCLELPYLQACIEEVLRIYSPVKIGLPRVTPPEGLIIDGKFVPGETVVSVHTLAAAVSETNFRDAKKFIPERWIGNEYASDKKGARQPFSVGPRNCIGQAFAYHEMRLVVATLVFAFDMQVRKECDNWGIGQRVFAITEKRPLLVDFKPRF